METDVVLRERALERRWIATKQAGAGIQDAGPGLLVRQLVDDGLAAVAAIHDLNMAARYCDRLMLMSDGQTLAEGTPEKVLSPETIATAFGVNSSVYRDPATGSLAVSIIGPADKHSVNGNKHTLRYPSNPGR